MEEEQRDRLEVTKSFRIYEDIVEEAKKHTASHPDKYENFSHYVRVALNRLNRMHREIGGYHGQEKEEDNQKDEDMEQRIPEDTV